MSAQGDEQAGTGVPRAATKAERVLEAKIARAMSSGPRSVTRDATVAEMDGNGNTVVLRQDTNDWMCFPGDENVVGNVPMCADPMGLQWMMDIMAGKPAPPIPLPESSTCFAAQRNTAIPTRSTGPLRRYRLDRIG